MKNKNLLIVLGLIGIAVGGYFLFNKEDKKIVENQNNNDEENIDETIQEPIQNVIPNKPLDYSKVLKLGSTGAEVKELQRLLGISQDGVFGPQTQSALFNKRGVYQTTLNLYTYVAGSLVYNHKIGDSIYVKSTVPTVNYENYSKNSISNSFQPTGLTTTFHANEYVGKVVEKRVSEDGKPLYMVEKNNVLFSSYVLVSEKYIK